MGFVDPFTYFMWICLTLLLVGYALGGAVTLLGSLVSARPTTRASDNPGTGSSRVGSTAVTNPDA